MTRPSRTEWHLKPSDVQVGRHWSRSSARPHGVARTSRTAAGTQQGHLTLRHVPTGVTIEGQTARGRYTRKEMGRLMDELKTRLWSDLERQVARHLRIPGR